MSDADGGGHGGSTAAIAAAFLANLGIAIAKFVGFVLTGSSALLAESVHSVADASNQGLLVLGGRRARREPTPLHPFGYGRARYFWAFVVAVVLFSLGGLFSIYEGYKKISDPHEITSPAVAFAILAVAIVFEAFALRTAVRHAQPERRGRSWWRYFRTSRSPELPVLLLEDSGALIGLVLAGTGIALALVTGNPLFDGLGTLAIGVLLLVIAIVLAIEMKSLLIGEAASPEMIRSITAEIERGSEVRGVIHMLTQHLGPDELLVAARVEFDPALSVGELTGAIDSCESRVRSAVPIARVIYLEPEVSGPAPGALPR
ncbi:MAG: cation diffusion facilitator family transporter [Gaiellaceae bacterium]